MREWSEHEERPPPPLHPRLKPNTKQSNAGFLQVRVQNYGGGLWYTWWGAVRELIRLVLVDPRL